MDKVEKIKILIEEWKKNVDLHIHHDNLKQQRFRHFITIQAFIFTIFGLSIRDSIQSGEIVTGIIGFLASLLSITISYISLKLSKRAYDYIIVVRSYLRELEMRIWGISKDIPLRTYSVQYHILYSGRMKYSNQDDMCEPTIVEQTNTKKIRSASANEDSLIRIFMLIWIVLCILSVSNIYIRGKSIFGCDILALSKSYNGASN